MSDCCEQLFSDIFARTFIDEMMIVCFVQDQHAVSDSYIASSLKQQSRGRHVVPLRPIILTLSLNVECSIEVTNTDLIVFGMTGSKIELTTYHIWKQTHYNTVNVISLRVVVVSFIGGVNQSTRRKPQTCYKSLTNFITWYCIKYTAPWTGFELITLVIIVYL